MEQERWSDVTTKIPEQPCPVCSKELNAATEAELQKSQPKEGDYSICGECASILVFNEDLSMRRLPEEDFVELPLEARTYLKKAQECILEYIEWNSKVYGK